jgi:hypothetical protein
MPMMLSSRAKPKATMIYMADNTIPLTVHTTVISIKPRRDYPCQPDLNLFTALTFPKRGKNLSFSAPMVR